MIQEFVNRFMRHEDAIRATLRAQVPSDYGQLVRIVIEAIADADEYDTPDPERITRIDEGDYQGTLVFIIACTGYQPSEYWGVKVYYGSCSGCDTLCAIRDSGSWDQDEATDAQVDDYWTLCLHIVQQLKAL